jgi:peptide/nickel transport system ATP-binding protein
MACAVVKRWPERLACYEAAVRGDPGQWEKAFGMRGTNRAKGMFGLPATRFQSAMNALNPVLSVGDQLTGAVHAHRRVSRREAADMAVEMLKLVDINADRLKSYPHQLSGGMKQRAMIAMALILKPDLLIMDEPTTALDVVVQRSIIEKIDDLRKALGFSVIFITHDLSLLVEISDDIAIMYAGKICEYGPAREIHARPNHPYTEGLMNSFPALSGPRKRLAGIEGRAPDLLAPPPGCRFSPRCPRADARCTESEPELADIGGGRLCACSRIGGRE